MEHWKLGRSGDTAPLMYTWHAPARLGITDDPAQAEQHLLDALRNAPAGAEGTVHKVALSPWGHLEYIQLGEVTRARRGPDGDVIWTSP